MRSVFLSFCCALTFTLLSAPWPLSAASDTSAPLDKSSAQEIYRQGLQFFGRKDLSPEDKKTAFDLFQQAADQGSAEALSALGYCHLEGFGVSTNPELARSAYQSAAEKGVVEAQVNLGRMLLHGRGITADPEQGLVWIQKAAESGKQLVRMILAETYFLGEHQGGDPDLARARQIVEPLAVEGFAPAQNMLGVILRDAPSGDRDLEGARKWLLAAAEQKDAKACANLGEMETASSDHATRLEGLKWILIGKELGEISAQYTLEYLERRFSPAEIREAGERAKAFLAPGK